MVVKIVGLWFLEFWRTEQPGIISSLDQIVVRFLALLFGQSTYKLWLEPSFGNLGIGRTQKSILGGGISPEVGCVNQIGFCSCQESHSETFSNPIYDESVLHLYASKINLTNAPFRKVFVLRSTLFMPPNVIRLPFTVFPKLGA